MKNSEQFNNPMDYFNKLKQYTTNPRGPSQQLYKNYRNEGVGNYPHMQDYERTMAQQTAQAGEEQRIKNQYETNKNKLIQEEEAKYNAQQAENERLRGEQAQQGQQQLVAQPINLGAQQMANIKKGGAWFTPSVSTQRQQLPKPRTLFTIDPNASVIFHNTQQGNGTLAHYTAPFSTYGANHPYMRLTGENLNHGKWYDPNNGRYYNTQY